MDQPLKALGEFSVALKLHRDVTVQIKVVVAKQDSEEPSA
jgi:ribosomal protein L9